MSETTENTVTGLELVTKTKTSLEEAIGKYPDMFASAQRATAALSKIIKIETDEEDKIANDYLVKSKLTYEKIKGLREAITKPLDEVKSLMMEPEKTVSLEASHTKSEALRVKKLRDGYAIVKAKEVAIENQKIAAIKNRDEELARLKAEFTTVFHANILTRAAQLREGIADYFNSITLENFAEKSKRFSLKPTLKAADFEGWFIIPYDKSKLSTEDFANFLAGQKQQLTYEEVNKIYLAQAEPIVLEFKNKLPALEVQLKQEAELEKTNAAAAEKQRQQRQESSQAETKHATDLFQQQIEEKKEEAQQTLQQETLEAEFNAQIATQQNSDQSNVTKRKFAKIVGPPANIVKIMSAVLFACYSNPSFEGHFKRDRSTKAVLLDENNDPILADWADKLLTFFANNCDAKVDGLEIHEKIGTIIKK